MSLTGIFPSKTLLNKLRNYPQCDVHDRCINETGRKTAPMITHPNKLLAAVAVIRLFLVSSCPHPNFQRAQTEQSPLKRSPLGGGKTLGAQHAQHEIAAADSALDGKLWLQFSAAAKEEVSTHHACLISRVRESTRKTLVRPLYTEAHH